MKFTNWTAHNMWISFDSMLQTFGQKKVSSVIIFGIMRNIRLLSTELTEFNEIKQKCLQKYKIDEAHKNDADIEERIKKCNLELNTIGQEEIEVHLHQISYNFDQLQENLENADVLISMQDIMFLQLICKREHPDSNEK